MLPEELISPREQPVEKEILAWLGRLVAGEYRAAFDPAQPRDDHGRWSGGGGDWNEGPAGERPYGWDRPSGDAYVVPEITHKVIRENGAWGASHANSQVITGASAERMGIAGYHYGPTGGAERAADKFLAAIAEDTAGSEEVLHHSFENVRGTEFAVGDTLRLPLTATSGDVGSYGVRLDANDQRGEPTVFEFEHGTQMVAYSGTTLRDAKDLGHATVHDALKESGKVWDEAIVAGGFEVVGVKKVYMGSQHNKGVEGGMSQLYGRVVRLQQTETFHPTEGWKKRG